MSGGVGISVGGTCHGSGCGPGNSSSGSSGSSSGGAGSNQNSSGGGGNGAGNNSGGHFGQRSSSGNSSSNYNQGRNNTGKSFYQTKKEDHARYHKILDAIISQPPIDVSATLKEAQEVLEAAKQQLENPKVIHLTNFQIAVLIALGLMVVPAAVASAASMTMTAMLIGPVGEVFGLEILANSAMLQAATRAGLVVGGGKVLNLFGMFKPGTISQGAISEVKEVIGVESHPLYGYSVEKVVQKAAELGLDTEPNSLLLWSRIGREGPRIAEEFAIKNGYTTLEMTPGGKWLNEVFSDIRNSPFTKEEITQIWEQVSRELVMRASGQVNSILGNVKPGGVYMKVEMAAMRDNPKILGLDQLQLFPRMIFK